MINWDTIVRDVSDAVRKEATSAPALLADLAQLERYIAESYQQRTFIELLQNADDANASRAACVIRAGYVVFANDGRAFTEGDFRSICRSGASLKHSEGGKIGYRGIGFKSTTNLARQIHVFSGSLSFTFSRDLTEKALGTTRVPGIRMPHPLEINGHIRSSVEASINGLRDGGYHTFFVLESENVERVADEFSSLDGDSLLFLAHLESVTIQSQGLNRKILIVRTPAPPFTLAEVHDDSIFSRWLVYSHPDDPATALAVPVNEDQQFETTSIKPQPIHSFLPTQEFSGFPFRVNADFSTDPSRTRIAFDDRTREAIARLVDTLHLLLSWLGNSTETPPWMAQMFGLISTPVGFSRVGDKLRQAVLAKSRQLSWLPGSESERSQVHGRPEWLNPEDFGRVMGDDNVATEALVRLDSKCPQLMLFLRQLDVSPISVDRVMGKIDRLSDLGKADLIQHLVDRLRETGSETLLRQLETLPVWVGEGGEPITIKQARKHLPERFKRILSARLTPAAIQWVQSNWNIAFDTSEPVTAANATPSNAADLRVRAAEVVRTEKSVKRWRGCEDNLRQVLSERVDGTVTDVSQSNLGYDLEVLYRDGNKDHVEVKALSREGGDFSLTSNEYANASNLGDAYVLAICMQDETGFSWTLIRNPIVHLELTKRCRQWEWAASAVPKFTERVVF